MAKTKLDDEFDYFSAQIKRAQQVIDDNRAFAIRQAINNMVRSRGVDRTKAYVTELLQTIGGSK